MPFYSTYISLSSFVFKKIKAYDSEVCHATPNSHYVHCKEDADGAAVDFPLPNSENYVCCHSQISGSELNLS
jgi:hypothetical protein